MFCIRRLACGLIALAVLGACAPQVRKSDDGHYAWARQVVATLFGRQPAGETEVRVIADFAALAGRQRAAEALMGSSEFNAHWSDLLFDLLRAPREGDKDLSACVGIPRRTGPTTAALANWVKANSPTSSGAPGGEFNLADLLASSIAADDLSPFMRGYLFAFASRPLEGNQITETNKREDLYNIFENTFLGRNSTCLTCHNASWSMTGKASGWNRTYSPLGYFERSLLGAHEGSTSPTRVKAMFRVFGVVGGFGEGSPPWGMAEECGTFSQPVDDDTELAMDEQAYLAGDRGRRASIFSVEQILRTGIGSLSDGLDRSVGATDQQACAICGSCSSSVRGNLSNRVQRAREVAVRQLFQNRGCMACHAGGLGGLLMRNDDTFKDQLVRVASRVGMPAPRVEPGHAENSFLVNALTGFTRPDGTTFRMPPFGNPLDTTDIDTVRAWINGMPASAGCDTCATNSPGLACPAPYATVPGDEAFAYLIALNLTDKIWAQVVGRPLTIAHHFSRNTGQRDLLWHMTEVQFVANGWSLKKLLGFIVASDYYNRRPPEDGDGVTTPSGSGSPYEMPMFFDPWVEQDPRVPPATSPGYAAADHPDRHANAMSEGIERKTPVTLLRSVSAALGWPAPQRTPSPNDFPSRDFAATLGQFLRDSVPGFRGENFDAFVEWEAEVARCRKPPGLAADWIDRLETTIRSYNAANPGNVITVAQAAEIVRDWLLADGRMSVNERALVAQVFGAAENDSTAMLAALNDRLRDYCGVLLEAPHFKLAGLSADGVGPPPKLRVCNGAPCTYREVCDRLISGLSVRGFVCEDQSVRTIVRPGLIATPQAPRAPIVTMRQAQPSDLTATILAAAVTRNLSLEPSRFRLAVKPDQLQKGRVAQVKGVAVVDAKGVTILQPGAAIPPNAIVISEPGAQLNLSVNRATVPVPLGQNVVPAGTIAELDRALSALPPRLRDRVLKLGREGATPADIAKPEHGASDVPLGTVEAALSAAFPFGSAGNPAHPARTWTAADDRKLQKRIEAERARQQRLQEKSK